jgi:hypothetical protein
LKERRFDDLRVLKGKKNPQTYFSGKVIGPAIRTGINAQLKMLQESFGNRFERFADEEEYDSCEICNEYQIKVQALLDSIFPILASSSTSLSIPVSKELHTSSSDTVPVASIALLKKMQSIRPVSTDSVVLKKRISEGMNSSGKSVIVDALFTGANTREQIKVKVKVIDIKHLFELNTSMR